MLSNDSGTLLESLTYKKLVPIERNRIYFGAPLMSVDENNLNCGMSHTGFRPWMIFAICIIMVIFFMLIFACCCNLKQK